jgi:hypothetical protein
MRETRRQDLLQVLAYANLAPTRRVICCLVYPCSIETWNSSKERGLLFHQAELTHAGRPVEIWLTALPMDHRTERITSPLVSKILRAVR